MGVACEVTIDTPFGDSSLKNAHLTNTNNDCPDGVLLLDPQNDLADAVSYEGIVQNAGAFGGFFNPPEISYNAGIDAGFVAGESLQKMSGIGRATLGADW